MAGKGNCQQEYEPQQHSFLAFGWCSLLGSGYQRAVPSKNGKRPLLHNRRPESEGSSRRRGPRPATGGLWRTWFWPSKNPPNQKTVAQITHLSNACFLLWRCQFTRFNLQSQQCKHAVMDTSRLAEQCVGCRGCGAAISANCSTKIAMCWTASCDRTAAMQAFDVGEHNGM